MFVVFVAAIILAKVPSIPGAKLDLIDCGIDNEPAVATGPVEIATYPWLGILYYVNYGEAGEMRATTTVALIHAEFVIGSAADIGPMSKSDFRRNSRVLLGENWTGDPRRVSNYVLHPEYEETYNTVAIVQLKDPVQRTQYMNIRPLCPPPDLLRNPEFYVVRFKGNYNDMQKEVVPVIHIPGKLCREFYIAANLYAKKMRPPHVACVVASADASTCVWDAGAALVARDHWGRWMLLGVGVRGPGCGAPARFLDAMSYYPWVERSLSKFSRITISKIHKQKYVLRSAGGSKSLQRFGDCDSEERTKLIYRELIMLKTDNNQYQFLTYNLTVYDSVEYSCLTLELVNASAVSEMKIKHYCPRQAYGPPCHNYKGSTFDISVFLMFSDKCRFEMFAWGDLKRMDLLDTMEWKWEEGTYYEDFSMTRVEYKGTMEQTGFGFEPLDEKMWVPDYDLWTTTEYVASTTEDAPSLGFMTSAEQPTPGPVKDYDAENITGPLFSDKSDEQESEFVFGMNW